MSEKTRSRAAAAACLSLGFLAVACQSGGVGDPCTPEVEFSTTFGGFATTEVIIETRSLQCATRICLANHFQGRVSCPYGQAEPVAGQDAPKEKSCFVPGTETKISHVVPAQLQARRASDAVYCSCRCAGSNPNAKYCTCPGGFICSDKVAPDRSPQGRSFGDIEQNGSYCIKQNTEWNSAAVDLSVCNLAENTCPSEQ